MTNVRKGIILAGGSGTRLYPLTTVLSKQLLPVYDKPMIYYPLSVLMLAGIQEVAIISTPLQLPQFESLLGDGSEWGLSFTYIEQAEPDGIAQAFILAEPFLDNSPSALILGDNLFYGHGLTELLRQASADHDTCTVFGCKVPDPTRFGIAGFDSLGKVTSVEEKPVSPKSDYAVTGLYFVDANAPTIAKGLQASKRGELEITGLLEVYVRQSVLRLVKMGRGFSWFDTGTQDSLLDAAMFVKTLQKNQGLMIGCPEEIAVSNDWVSLTEIKNKAKHQSSSYYSAYLSSLNKN